MVATRVMSYKHYADVDYYLHMRSSSSGSSNTDSKN